MQNLSIFPKKALSKFGFLVVAILLLIAHPAMAHHPLGGRLPNNFLEGFLSGIAHPMIGPDHFVFIIAVGLLAATKRQGIWLPLVFVTTALAGTGLHLLEADIPGLEVLIAASILVFGIFLSRKTMPSMVSIALLTALAGVFHGYAYGEAIVGAEPSPLFAYLTGFTTIQLGISWAAFLVTRNMITSKEEILPEKLRSVGLVIFGIGLAFLSSAVVAIALP